MLALVVVDDEGRVTHDFKGPGLGVLDLSDCRCFADLRAAPTHDGLLIGLPRQDVLGSGSALTLSRRVRARWWFRWRSDRVRRLSRSYL